MADEYKVVSEGSLLGNRWKIKRRVGRGTFSEIYEASDQHSARDATGRHPHQAIKVARDTHAKCSMLVHEQEVLRELQDSQWIPRYVELGKEDECQFLVMQLLGDNLSELRRTTPTKRFTLRTVALLGIQMVEAIREMHELGFVHRDIKPSNFCVGLPKIEDAEGATADGEEGRCYILDFGLARRWKQRNGEIRPARESVEFRGTCRYASKHSHMSEELGRRDDIWSLLYMLLELLGGELPWHVTKDRDAVLAMKRQHEQEMLQGAPASQVSRHGVPLPAGFARLMRHVSALGFEAEPDYELVRTELAGMLSPPPAAAAGSGGVALIDWAAEGATPSKRHVRAAAAARQSSSASQPTVSRGVSAAPAVDAEAAGGGPPAAPANGGGAVARGPGARPAHGAPPSWAADEERRRSGVASAPPERAPAPLKPSDAARTNVIVVSGLRGSQCSVDGLRELCEGWVGCRIVNVEMLDQGGSHGRVTFADVASAVQAVRAMDGQCGLRVAPHAPVERPPPPTGWAPRPSRDASREGTGSRDDPPMGRGNSFPGFAAGGGGGGGGGRGGVGGGGGGLGGAPWRPRGGGDRSEGWVERREASWPDSGGGSHGMPAPYRVERTFSGGGTPWSRSSSFGSCSCADAPGSEYAHGASGGRGGARAAWAGRADHAQPLRPQPPGAAPPGGPPPSTPPWRPREPWQRDASARSGNGGPAGPPPAHQLPAVCGPGHAARTEPGAPTNAAPPATMEPEAARHEPARVSADTDLEAQRREMKKLRAELKAAEVAARVDAKVLSGGGNAVVHQAAVHQKAETGAPAPAPTAPPPAAAAEPAAAPAADPPTIADASCAAEVAPAPAPAPAPSSSAPGLGEASSSTEPPAAAPMRPAAAPAAAGAKQNQCLRSPFCTNGFKHRGSCNQKGAPPGAEGTQARPDAKEVAAKAAKAAEAKAAKEAAKREAAAAKEAAKREAKREAEEAAKREAQRKAEAAAAQDEAREETEGPPAAALPGTKRKSKPSELAKLTEGGSSLEVMEVINERAAKRRSSRPTTGEDAALQRAIDASLADQQQGDAPPCEASPPRKKAAKKPRELVNLQEAHFGAVGGSAVGTRSWHG